MRKYGFSYLTAGSPQILVLLKSVENIFCSMYNSWCKTPSMHKLIIFPAIGIFILILGFTHGGSHDLVTSRWSWLIQMKSSGRILFLFSSPCSSQFPWLVYVQWPSALMSSGRSSFPLCSLIICWRDWTLPILNIDGEVCAPGLHGLSCLPHPFSHNLFACPSPFSILLHLFLCFSLTSCPPTNSPHIHAIYWTHSECQLYTSYEDVAFGLQELSNKGPASSRWGQKFQPWTKPLSLKRTFPLRKPNPQAPKTRNPKIILSLNHLTLNLIHHLA